MCKYMCKYVFFSAYAFFTTGCLRVSPFLVSERRSWLPASKHPCFHPTAASNPNSLSRGNAATPPWKLDKDSTTKASRKHILEVCCQAWSYVIGWMKSSHCDCNDLFQQFQQVLPSVESPGLRGGKLHIVTIASPYQIQKNTPLICTTLYWQVWMCVCLFLCFTPSGLLCHIETSLVKFRICTAKPLHPPAFPKKQQFALENQPGPKRKWILQPLIFRGQGG